MPNTRIYWLHALSPTHAGIGRGVGYIDLPIDRDGITGWPIIRGSAFKGVWADYYTGQLLGPDKCKKDARKADTPEGRLLKAAFGIAGDDNNSNAGALIPTDAQLVCLPVRSFRGTFAWCTSPLCLQMLRRTLSLAGEPGLPDAPKELADNVAHHATVTSLVEETVEGTKVFLEDLDFTAQECQAATKWAANIAEWVFPGSEQPDEDWRTAFKKRFVVLPDSAFDFLCETGTEVHTRVKIDPEMKVVEEGALWTEESLPAETILAGIVQSDRVFGRNGEDITPNGLLDRFAKDSLTLQIGGKATVGRGQMRCVFTPVNGGGQ
ncbi:MAG: type III-B CRISPR module RAMP protein Cmr4 [Thermoguttaceae bacterium]